MSSSHGGNGGSADKPNNKKDKGKSSSSSIITSQHKAYLEGFFERNPDENQQDQLTKTLGLQQEQVIQWFHDKGRQAKVSQPQPEFPIVDNSGDHLQNQEVPNSSTSPTPSVISDEADFLMEKSRMLEIAKDASQELYKLFYDPESIWFKSSHTGRFVLDHEKYKTMFPKDIDPNVFRTPNNTFEESSRAFTPVSIAAKRLVEVLLDPNEMSEYFQTMIQRAQLIKEYDHGLDETKHGALLLMYVEIHHLSHMVPPRKYFILRFCEQLYDCGIWMITDVSLDSFGNNLPYLPSWKLPSGYLIRQMPTSNGRNNCLVTLIEHVEANYVKPKNSLLYGDLLANNIPYSANRWTTVLQRNAERLHLVESTHYEAVEGISFEQRRILLHLSRRMLKSFCESLNIRGKPEITHFYEPSNNIKNGDIKYFLHKNSTPDNPEGMVANLVTSFWVPLNYCKVFNFLTDATKRNQWDINCAGHTAFEVVNVRIEPYDGNRVSVIRKDLPYFHDLLQPCETLVENRETIILQESTIDAVEAYIVYAPITKKNLQKLLTAQDDSIYSQLYVLPCGFVLTGDADSITHVMKRGLPSEQQRGTLITIGYQVLVSASSSTRDLKMKDLGIAHNMFRVMVSKLKIALQFSGLG